MSADLNHHADRDGPHPTDAASQPAPPDATDPYWAETRVGQRIDRLFTQVEMETRFVPGTMNASWKRDSVDEPMAELDSVSQTTDVRTWTDFFTYDSISDAAWLAMPTHNLLTLDFIWHPAVDMQSYRDYLRRIDVYTAVAVYERTKRLQSDFDRRCYDDTQTPLCNVEDLSDEDAHPMLSVSGVSRTVELQVAKHWAASQFNRIETLRLLQDIHDAAVSNNTLYLLPLECRMNTKHVAPELRLDAIPDVRAARQHVDYSSETTFVATTVAAIRRLSFLYHGLMDRNFDAMLLVRNGLLPIVRRAIGWFPSSIYDIIMRIMRALKPDDCVENSYRQARYKKVSEETVDWARRAAARDPNNPRLRTYLFAARRVAYDDYAFVDNDMCVGSTAQMIYTAFAETCKGPLAHPPLPHVTVFPFHAIACMILSGVDPTSVAHFTDRYFMLYDPLDAEGVVEFAQSVCVPLVWVMRQLFSWGDLTDSQMASLAAYINRPFVMEHITAIPHANACIDLAQILTSIPATCNLFRACMGDAQAPIRDCTMRSNPSLRGVVFSGSDGSARVRHMVFAVIDHLGSVDALATFETGYYVETPFSLVGGGPFRHAKTLLVHFNTHLLCVERGRREWANNLSSTTEPWSIDQGVLCDPAKRNLIVDVTSQRALLLDSAPNVVMQMTEMLRSYQLPSSVDNHHYIDRAVFTARANLDANYFAHHRALVDVARSRLFTTPIRNYVAPFSRSIPADVVSLIMQFVTPFIRPHGTATNTKPDGALSVRHIFDSVGPTFLSKLERIDNRAPCPVCTASVICASCSIVPAH